jgi:hypothetical protein
LVSKRCFCQPQHRNLGNLQKGGEHVLHLARIDVISPRYYQFACPLSSDDDAQSRGAVG